jgi:hypothetical protein
MTRRDGGAPGIGHSSAAGQSAPGEAAATAEDAVPELRHFGSTLPKTQQPNEEDAAFAPPPQPPPQAESPVGPAQQQQQQQGGRQGAEPLAAQETGPKSIERSPSSGRRLTPFPYDLASADGGLSGEQSDSNMTGATAGRGEPGSQLAASYSPGGPADRQPPVQEAGLALPSKHMSVDEAEDSPQHAVAEVGTAADGALAAGRPRASSAADDPFSTGRQAQLTSQTAEFQAATATAEQHADAELGMAAAAPGSEDAAPLPPATGEEAAAAAAAQGAAAVEPAGPGPAPLPTLPFYRCLPPGQQPGHCTC